MKEDKHEKLANRLASILIFVLNKEPLDVPSLAERFSVSTKTIRRDLVRLSSVLEKTETDGVFRIIGISNTTYLEQDIGSVIAGLGFNTAIPVNKKHFIKSILSDLDGSVYHFRKSTVEIDAYKVTDFLIIEEAIKNLNSISFFYNQKERLVEPYLIVYDAGIWYLAGMEGSILKNFSLSSIQLIRKTKSVFQIDETIKEKIKNSESSWLSDEHFEVVVEVSNEVSHYFLRRKILPNQEIFNKKENGNLIIKCKCCHFTQIAPTIQSWMPHLKVLQPSELNEHIRRNLEEFTKNLDGLSSE